MSTRPAVALLLVLAALVISTTAALALTRHTATMRLNRASSDAREVARSVSRGTPHIVRSWLVNSAPTAVVSPNSKAPAVAVCDDRIPTSRGWARVEITAFDQLGMIPWPIASQIDTESLAEAYLRTRGTVPSGLDDVVHAEDMSVYPDQLGARKRTWFGEYPQGDSAEPAAHHRGSERSVGQRFATHALDEVDLRSAQTPRWSLNVNTAPLTLIEAVLADSNIEATARIRDARREGELAPPPAGSLEFRGTNVRLVARSGRWAFRTDVTVDGVRDSRWTVYIRRGPVWVLEQNLVIAE